ncbi:ATP-binding protein [bacterium]
MELRSTFMGHLKQVKKEYRELQKRLHKNPVGAPESEHLYDILKILYSEEEARTAAMIPMVPATLGKISRRTGMNAAKLEKLLDGMANKGLVMDFRHEKLGKTFYMLAPPVVGFFEFSMMRERSDIPQKELAEAMYRYMYDTGDFSKEVFGYDTMLGRAMVHETAVSDEDLSEVLEWERATAIIEDAKKHSVSLCYCRHKARHVGHECGMPEEICLSMGQGADWLIGRNFAREISKNEALDLLGKGRELGLVHVADNVQQDPSFICNCCGCCCGMLGAINKHNMPNAVHTTGFLAAINLDECKGCGKCAKRCPIDAISIEEMKKEDGKKKKWAEVDESICLGCGVCEMACKFDSLYMKKRSGRKIITPKTALERMLTMAIERGRLQNFLFDEMSEGPTSEFFKNLADVVLDMPAARRLLLNREVKSRFLDFISRKAGM